MGRLFKKTWKNKSHHTEESKLKISISNKKVFSNPILRKRISERNKHKHLSLKTEFQKGHKYGFKKGYIPWNKGKKGMITISEAAREAISIRNRGRPSPFKGKKRPTFSKEWRENISRSLKGRTVSLDTRKKISISTKGSKSHLWKGGIESENNRIRHSLEYKLWREEVYARDNYMCVLGGKEHGSKLQVDHIKPFALYPDSRLDLNNGRTLCIECHKKTFNYLRHFKKGL